MFLITKTCESKVPQDKKNQLINLLLFLKTFYNERIYKASEYILSSYLV